MESTDINIYYIDWLLNFVCDEQSKASYNYLMETLFYTEFVAIMERDENRAEDGLNLRYDYCDAFGEEYNVIYHLDGRCSVLEMLISLAIRIERSIMTDFETDGTGFWFWNMITNLGLLEFDDSRFSDDQVAENIGKFLNRTYDADGKGGLFWVPNTKKDMRKMEIWFQMNEYLISIDDV